MTYSKSSSEKFTLIEDLIDLDEQPEQPKQLNSGYNNKDVLPNGQEDKYAKFIRQPHKPKYEDYVNNSNNIEPHPMHHANMNPMNGGNMHGQHDMIQESYSNQPYNIPMHSPYSCLDIAGHIENCPICSKFYNNDKTVYIIAIIILVIISIILLKKVLDK